MVSSFLCFAIVFACCWVFVASKNPSFDKNYAVSWGDYHVQRLNQGSEIQLTMDQNQGGAGFGSKVGYGSGFFSMRIKFPASKNTAGVVVAYYLKSLDKNSDEVDFEFLGDEEGKPITLQTNVITNGVGNREQRFNLWFDPTQDFHTYTILWNRYQLVFLVDDIPIRVFKNNKNIGVDYPSKEMYINVTIWDAAWATEGGGVQTNWTYAPFQPHFQGFSIHGCSPTYSCPKMWWNGQKYAALHPTQIKSYEHARKNYMNYDYCSDLIRNHNNPPPECPK